MLDHRPRRVVVAAIWAESDGGGATFRFRLPVRAPAEVSSAG